MALIDTPIDPLTRVFAFKANSAAEMHLALKTFLEVADPELFVWDIQLIGGGAAPNFTCQLTVGADVLGTVHVQANTASVVILGGSGSQSLNATDLALSLGAAIRDSASGILVKSQIACSGAGPHWMGMALLTPLQPSATPWYAAASSVEDRLGFASPLVEFEGKSAPEISAPAEMLISFANGASTGTITVGAPVNLETSITGSFVGSILNASGTVGGFTIDVSATVMSEVLNGTVTITAGSNTETRLFLAAQEDHPVVIPNGYWVDLENGNDAFDGLSSATPKATIAGLPLLIPGDRIYLARGSRWREMLDTSGLVACQAINYGIGPRPVLDACDVVQAASWTKTAGRTNVYECTITGENPGGSSFSAIVLQDGWQLEPVADLTACDAAAGTHVVQGMASGAPVTIYVNLYGASKVPVDNQVEISTRPTGFNGVGAVRLEGVMCRSGWSTSGSVTINASVAAIDNAYVDDCVALHSNDHNMLFPGGEVHRTVLLGTNSGSNANAMIAVYRSSIDPAAEVLLHELACIQFPQLTNATLMNTYVAHAGDATDWQDVTLSRCYSYYGIGWSVHHGLVDECLFERPHSGGGTMIGVLTVAGQLTISNTRLLGAAAGTGYSGAPIQNGAGNLVIENVASWFPGDSLTGGHVMQRGGTCSISNALFTATATDFWNNNTTAASVSVSRISCPRGARVTINGSTITPVDFVACLAASDWRENFAATARDFFPNYVTANAYGDCATYTTTLPVYEPEADPNRPIFLETAASVAARGWNIGPVQTRPGSGVSWVTPEVGAAWRTFIDGLSGPPV